jgi:glycolate oxidase iron-sulfur subunit
MRRAVPPLDAVVTGNPGCVMQIGAGLRAAGLKIPVMHPVELLDRAYALEDGQRGRGAEGRKARKD